MKLYPDDWKVRMTYAVSAGVCMAAAMYLGPRLGIHGFWPSILGIVGAILIGNLILGPLVIRLIGRP